MWERTTITPDSVQQAYVSSRLREINSRKNRGRLVEQTLQALQDYVPSLAWVGLRSLERAYSQLNGRLRRSELTINLRAPSWFMEENLSESYLQMYERAIRGDEMVLTNNDPLNPLLTRVKADNRATLLPNWKKGPLQPTRGLDPDVGRRRIAQKMSPGKLQPQRQNLAPNDPEQEFKASNHQFDPRTKQVFAALNYGRRFHGSSTQYGHSYMVLDDKFKANALYLAGDTFLALRGHANTAEHQVSYDLLAALLVKTANNPSLREDLLKSCLQNTDLPDTNDGYRLVEVHLFEKLLFKGNITHLYISTRDRPKDADGNELAWTGELLTRVRENARKFATRHGAKLTFID